MEMAMVLMLANVALAPLAGQLWRNSAGGSLQALGALLTVIAAGIALFTYTEVDGHEGMTALWLALSGLAAWRWYAAIRQPSVR